MKKIGPILMAIALLINNLVVFANENNIYKEIVLLVGSNQSIVNGEKLAIDSKDPTVKPIVKNSRTLVPIRFISEKFNAKVDWDKTLKTVSIIQGNNKLELVIDVLEIKKNGVTTELDVAPMIINGRTFLPLRAIVDAMGKELYYDSGLIIISDIVVSYDKSYLFNLKSKLNNEVALLIGSNRSIINNLKKYIDNEDPNVKPIINNNRTLVPIRFVVEAFGAKVEWDKVSKSVSIIQDNNKFELIINIPEIKKNGIATKLDVAPVIINGRTYLPLRAIVDSMGKALYYNDGLIIISDVAINYNYEKINQLIKQLEVPKKSSEIANEAIKSVVIIESSNSGEENKIGTGFFVGDGLVMTAFHVIEDYEEIRIEDYYGNIYEVEGIYKYDITRNLVVLKLNKQQSVKSLQLRETNSNVIGEKIVTIGHSLGLNWSVTEGVINSFRKDTFMDSILIQTDAAVSSGSSGAPLLNNQGKVIGVISNEITKGSYNFATIFDGEVKIDYQSLDFNRLEVVPKTDFILSEEEEQNIYKITDDILKGLITNDKDLYLSTMHPQSTFLEIEKASFDDLAKHFNGYSYQINNIESKKYGNTIISTADITLLNDGMINTKIISRFSYDPHDDNYKLMVSIILLNKVLENVIEKIQALEYLDIDEDYYEELSFEPYDVKYDTENGLIYMVDKDNKRLIKYSVMDKKIKVQNFEYTPERLDLADGKIYLILTPDKTYYYTGDKDKEGYVGIVDASTLRLIKILDVGYKPFNIIANDGYIFLTSYSQGIKSFSEETGIELGGIGTTDVSQIKMSPIKDRLYATTGTRPRDMKVFFIDKGNFITIYDSIYHGDYEMDIGFKISPDGKYIYNYSGVIFKTGYGKEGDMLYYKKFNQSYNSIAFDLGENKIYINAGDAGNIYIYNYETFEYLGTVKTLGKVKYMNIIGDELVTIEQKDEIFGINVIKIK
ncbi:hypothetical protein BHF71_10770 [Vulcanibacillus modesticaldus]|uniref:Copper amine oxidase-like N-terminal domain-containing protein n=1 Tax=Vulcanibacillus modesticaldus TaxID=337097 RepID=A0A1D2YT15_9BACI|nr:stalk domain-containing protein [Vulcanibacillus modesticaldus]OEF98833.1 hypothetical protein BHF71_10770 [Vulcanibacillus modesticaldus]